MTPYDQQDPDTLRDAMHSQHTAFVNRLLSNGILPPWMEIDWLASRDEVALMTRIADHGPVQWSGSATRIDLARALGFNTVANLKATVHKALDRGLTRHYLDGSVEMIGLTMLGRWILDILEARDDE